MTTAELIEAYNTWKAATDDHYAGFTFERALDMPAAPKQDAKALAGEWLATDGLTRTLLRLAIQQASDNPLTKQHREALFLIATCEDVE